MVNTYTIWDADAIKALRRANGLTQPELAFLLGCHLRTVVFWEAARYLPSVLYQQKLTEVAGVLEIQE